MIGHDKTYKLRLANSKMPHRGRFVALGGALMVLAGCQAPSSSQTSTQGLIPASRPLELAAKSVTAQSLIPTSVVAPIFAPPDQKALARAIYQYRINKRLKPGPMQQAVSDLNGDGKAEALVLFSGDDWCTETGCTLTVFTQGRQGYVPVSTTKRVSAPVIFGAKSSNGWQNIHVKTGGAAYGKRSVTLRFSGGGYPGNAITLTPLPADVTPPGQILIDAQPAVADAQQAGATGIATP